LLFLKRLEKRAFGGTARTSGLQGGQEKKNDSDEEVEGPVGGKIWKGKDHRERRKQRIGTSMRKEEEAEGGGFFFKRRGGQGATYFIQTGSGKAQ